jgi:hypothetical protein
VNENYEISQIVNYAIKCSKESPVGAAVKIIATPARKEAIKKKQFEAKDPL